MIAIVNGVVFIDGHKTKDPEIIGYAILDFAESQEQDNIAIILKDQDVFVEALNS